MITGVSLIAVFRDTYSGVVFRQFGLGGFSSSSIIVDVMVAGSTSSKTELAIYVNNCLKCELINHLISLFK